MPEQNLTPLWFHQEEAIKRARNLPSYALHFEPGTGKSRTAIEIIRHRFNTDKRILRTLIFTPPIVVPNFRDEWLKFSKIDRKDVICLLGSGAQRFKTFIQNAFNEKGERRGKVFVLNYQSLLMHDLYAAFKQWQPEITVQDESHVLKNPSSKMAKALSDLVNRYSKPSLRLNLSGTAVLNSPMDLFQQFLILMGGFPTLDSLITGKHITNFFTFRALYFEDKNARFKGRDNYFPCWEAKPSINEVFGRILSVVSMSVKKEDCLSLPGEIDITIPTPLTPQQRRDYDKFEKDMVLNIEGKNYTADIAMVRALRLMQITSGFISGLEQPDNSESQPIRYEYPDTEREKALKELLLSICVENGKKVLCWAVWKQNYATIRKVCVELGLKFIECHGEVSPKDKEIARKTFIEDPSFKVWIGNPLSSGVGINLVVAPYSIWFSRNFSLDQFIQAKARNYRAGQTEKVTHYHLVSSQTIEPEIVEALKNKQDIGELILSKTNLYKK